MRILFQKISKKDKSNTNDCFLLSPGMVDKRIPWYFVNSNKSISSLGIAERERNRFIPGIDLCINALYAVPSPSMD